ncbi:phosphotransferase KptA/Tpt1 [Globomyces pollinis-pini]|nr:phosphotransferase KptA/Tpt1 [Globomyces pollinis-pini]
MDRVRLSKLLSYILRHNAAKEGIPINEDGFVLVTDLLQHQKFKNATLDDIQQVVANCQKSRFLLKQNDTGEYVIRANQGHSMKEIKVELEVIQSPEEIPTVIHGTYLKPWSTIRNLGLSRMKRQHIHFAVGKFGEEGVTSGMRATCNVFIFINAETAMKAGIQFYRSENNVILSDGIDGIIPTEYFLKVEDKNGNLLQF